MELPLIKNILSLFIYIIFQVNIQLHHVNFYVFFLLEK